MEITLQQAWNQAAQTLQAANIAQPRLEAQYLLCAHLAPEHPRDVGYLYTHASTPLPRPGLFAERLAQRSQHRPLSRLVGRRAFWRDVFVITNDVLDPRPDSEALIETALCLYSGRNSPRYILDLGCGSGCLVLSLLREFPHATAVGSDISEAALSIARVNAQRLGLSSRVGWAHSDWWNDISGRFDLIVCNPPYLSTDAALPPAVQNHDPPLALYANNRGLAAYTAITKRLGHHLTPRGVAIVESSPWQTPAIAELAHGHDLACFSPLNRTLRPLCPPQQLGLCVISSPQ